MDAAVSSDQNQEKGTREAQEIPRTERRADSRNNIQDCCLVEHNPMYR